MKHNQWKSFEGVLVSQMSHTQKPSYFPVYWLVNKDPCNGLLYATSLCRHWLLLLVAAGGTFVE